MASNDISFEEELEVPSYLASEDEADRLTGLSDPEDEPVLEDDAGGDSDNEISEIDNNDLLVKYDFKDHYLEDETAESTAESEQQVRDGMLEIKKLDRHLKRLLKMEHESKRNRLRFEAQMVKEFDELSEQYPNSANNCPTVQANTLKFLAIDMPFQKRKKKPRDLLEIAAGNESESEESSSETDDSNDDKEDSDSDVVPVFTTELPDEQYSRNKTGPSSLTESVRNASSSSEYATANSSPIDGTTSGDKIGKNNVNSRAANKNTPRKPKEAFIKEEGQSTDRTAHSKKRAKKNFVARNIQLAMDAASNVPMTDDEKKRLSELLADIDEEPDNAEAVETTQSDERALVLKNNDGTLSSRSSVAMSLFSEGYKPSEVDIEKLSDIDNRLHSLTSRQGSSHFGSRNRNGSISTSLDTWRDTGTKSSSRPLPSVAVTQNIISRFSVLQDTRADALASIMEDIPTTSRSFDSDKDHLGEKALIEVREARELSTRLDTIDEQLAELTGSHPYPVEVELPKLAASEIRSLVSQCVSVLSEQDNNDEESSITTYDDVLLSANRLPDSVLHDLLNQAKKELGLLTLEAPEQFITNARDDYLSGGSSVQLYDNETWSFLREVEAHLEYPPAFLRALPEPISEVAAEKDDPNITLSSMSPVVKNEEPIVRTFSGRLAQISESQEIRTPKPGTPTLMSEESLRRSASDLFKNLQSPTPSSPTVPPLNGRRRSLAKSETADRASAESRKSNSASNNQREKDLSSLRLDGTAFSASSNRK